MYIDVETKQLSRWLGARFEGSGEFCSDNIRRKDCMTRRTGLFKELGNLKLYYQRRQHQPNGRKDVVVEINPGAEEPVLVKKLL